MKKILLLVIISVSSQAAKIGSCKDKVLKACGNSQLTKQMVDQAVKMTEGDQCSIIESKKIEGTANDKSPERAVFKSDQKLISVVIPILKINSLNFI